MLKGKFIPLVFIIICSACTSSVNKEGMMKYISNPQNGLYQENTFGYNTVELQYKPTDLIVQQHANSYDSLTNNLVDSLRIEYDDYWYFNISFSYNKLSKLNQYTHNKPMFSYLVNELSFNMSQNVRIINQNSDTTYVADYTFPRMYNYAAKNTLLFVFNNKKLKDTKSFKLEIDEFGFELGKQVFTVKTKDIQNTTTLKITQKQ